MSGTIHKSYSAPYTYITNPCVAWGSRTYTSTRKVGNSYVTSTRSVQYCIAHVTHFNTMPATWQLCVDGVDKEGRKASNCWYTDPSEYDTWREGDHWPRNG